MHPPVIYAGATQSTDVEGLTHEFDFMGIKLENVSEHQKYK